jgi:hypothetical protein
VRGEGGWWREDAHGRLTYLSAHAWMLQQMVSLYERSRVDPYV